MYTNAQYVNGMDGKPSCINAQVGDLFISIPLDPANTDYQNIMKLVAEGKLTIAPA
jgi:hypothetical protein